MIFEVQYLDTRKKEKFECPQTKCVVGRSKNADVSIVREELSRSHFEIEYVNKTFFLTDLNSTNGLIVNGERLPAGQRVPYQNIFPIEIGDKISILVSAEADGMTEEEAPSLERFNVRKTSVLSAREETKTKVAPRKPMGATSRSHKNSGPAQKTNPQMLITLLVVLMMGAGLYYYYDQKEDVVVSEATSTAGEEIKENPSLTPPPYKPSELDFDKLLTQNQCERFSPLCQTLKLDRPQENIMEVGEKLIVFVNVGDYKVENAAQGFSELKDQERYEYILAYTGLTPDLVVKARDLKVTHLLLVGFSSVEGLTVVKGVLNINYKVFSEITADFHKNFFSNIFYGGIFRDYKMDVRPYVKFQSF